MPILMAPAMPVSAEQRSELTRMARSTSLPHRTVVQAKALLMAGNAIAMRRSPGVVKSTRTRCAGGVRASWILVRPVLG